MSEFEKWFEDQDFYTNMRFIHGDKLFDRDGGAYRVLPVQMTYLAWLVGRAGIKEMDQVIKMQDADLRKYEKQIEDQQKRIDEALQEVKGLERFTGEDCIADFDVLQGAVSHACKRLEKTLRGDHE